MPSLSLGDLPDPGLEPTSPGSLALAGRFFTTEPLGKPRTTLEELGNQVYYANGLRGVNA